MILSRRSVAFLGLSFLFVLFLTARNLSQPWRNLPQAVGLSDFVYPVGDNTSKAFTMFNVTTGYGTKNLYAPQPNFIPGTPKPPGSEYSKMLVIPRTTREDVDWIAEELPDWGTAIYTADDPSAPLHPPTNKGHEVMIYLTFVIDFYDELPDVAVFMHSHRDAWHNDEIFGGDAVEILRRLSMPRVIREGYMNTRCNLLPGCPDWIHPGAVVQDQEKQEEIMMARAWGELFPDEPVPSALGQPCCAQFALSRDRIRTIPRSRFIFYRDWLLQTDFSDYIAGRIWEYLWQYVFTGQPVVCVPEHICLCDGYGVCFGGSEEHGVYHGLAEEHKRLQESLNDWVNKADEIEAAQEAGELDETKEVDLPSLASESEMREQIQEKEEKLMDLLEAAMKRGENPRYRAMEVGRPWKDGDGF